MLEELKAQVCKANLDLLEHGLVLFTWGNVSGIDKDRKYVVIKPSGVSYKGMKPEDMVVVDMDAKVIEGKYKPSSDLLTHLELYKSFQHIGGLVHTHSTMATSWAQAGKSIPALGTTHADYYYGDIPCTRRMKKEEVENDYELNTGKLIVSTFSKLDASRIPGVLVHSHGPFNWGITPDDAVHNAVVMEELAHMAFNALQIGAVSKMDSYLLDKHYLRKHGKDAYYGQ